MSSSPLAITRFLLITTLAISLSWPQTAVFSASDFMNRPSQQVGQRLSAPTIVGGRDANLGEYPWQVLLTQGCGGSLIAAQWVLTAAHCVIENNHIDTNFTIYLGIHDISNPDANIQSASPIQVIPHPDYADNTHDNDLALIKLASPVTLNNRVAVIGLASNEDSALFNVGKLATVTGWGVLYEGGPAPDILQTVTIPIVSNQTCNSAYQDGITANMLCAGYAEGGKDACQGDSGGPLIVADDHGSWKQAGIVSFGVGCAEPNYYGVYTRLSRYSTWISAQIGGPVVTPTPTTMPTPVPTAIPTATPERLPVTLTLTADSGVTGIFLDWNPAALTKVAGYRVLRTTAALSTTVLTDQRLDTDYADEAETAGNQLTSGGQYCYTVEALDSQANIVTSSNLACAIFGQLHLATVDTQVKQGEAVTMPVAVRNATDLRIGQSAIVVNYDANLLSYQAVTSTVLTLGYRWTVSNTAAGQLEVHARPEEPATPPTLYGNGALFALTFNATGQAEQQSPLDLQAYDPLSQTGSTITALSSENLFFDAPLRLQGSVVRITDQPVYFRGDVNGDGSLSPADVDRMQQLLVDSQIPISTVVAAGDVNSNGQLDAGDTALLAYRVAHDAWPPLPAINLSGQTTRIAQANSLLQLTSISAKAGDVVTTTLQVTTENALIAGEFSIVYDPKIVEEIVSVRSPLTNAQVGLNTTHAGLLPLTLVTTTPISGQQTLLTIIFKLRADAPGGASPLQLADAALYDLNGRNLVRSFANQTLTRQNATIQVQAVSRTLYLPMIRR
ncbi:MAG: trypsin-like serine protease [Chloroflexi bacterium]|nr:trypsin-like serine protease [Chloroflexota bacterium]